MNGNSRWQLRSLVSALVVSVGVFACLNGALLAAELAPDPVANQTEIKLPGHVSIPFPKKSAFFGNVIYPSTPSRFVLIGHGFACSQSELWDVQENKRVALLNAKLDASDKIALSPDGKYLAFERKSGSKGQVDVWSFATGQLLKEIDVAPQRTKLAFVDFAGPEEIVVASAPGKKKRFEVWNVTSGESTGAITAKANYSDKKSITLGPGRKFLAFANADGQNVTIHDLQQRAFVKNLLIPRPTGVSKYTCNGLRFSPDGTELGGLFSSGSQWWMLGWSLENSNLVINFPVPADLSSVIAGASGYKGAAYQWLPDGSAWLLYGHGIVDRNSTRLVWMLKTPSKQVTGLSRSLITNDYLLAVMGSTSKKYLETFELPWAKIDGALEQINSDSPAYLKPGQEVSLQVELGKLRHSEPDAVKKQLTETMTKRLQQAGFKVAEGKTAVMQVTYSEAPGRTLKKSNRNSIFPRGPFRIGPRIPRPRIPFGPFRRQSKVPAQRTADSEQKGSGTGFVIHADGYLLTCAHVVEGAKLVEVTLAEKKYKATVLATDSKLDLALLQIPAKGLPVLPLADSSKAELGIEVRAIGFPLSNVLGTSIKATRGTLAGLVTRNGQKLFQVDASINPGNSGGPLVNQLGQVIAINSAKIVGEAVDSVGFSIPINQAAKMLKEKKVESQTKGADKKLDGPALIKKVSPAVALITTGSLKIPANPGIASGDTLQSTKISCKLAWNVPNHKEPVWSHDIALDPRTIIIRGGSTEKVVRDSVFRMFLISLAKAPMISYISQGDEPLVLPGVTEITRAPAKAVVKAKEAKVGATRKPTRRGQPKE